MIRKLAVSLILLASAAHVLAKQTGPNGGLIAGAGVHKAELVVSSDGKAHESKGATFRAVVQQGGKTKTVNLADEQGKRLVGKLDVPLDKGAIVVITGSDSHGDLFNARYVIK